MWPNVATYRLLCQFLAHSCRTRCLRVYISTTKGTRKAKLGKSTVDLLRRAAIKSSASYDVNDARLQAQACKVRLIDVTTEATARRSVEVLKIINRFDNVNFQNWFQSAHSGRGHSYTFLSSKYSFSNRVIENWNQLPKDIVTCTLVNSFKKRFDRFMHNRWFI